MPAPVLPPLGPDWAQWGRQLSSYLSRQLPRLFTKSTGDNPSENGIILWDEVNGYPVVSKNNEWRQVVLEDGHANFILTSDVTPALANTAYKCKTNLLLVFLSFLVPYRLAADAR